MTFEKDFPSSIDYMIIKKEPILGGKSIKTVELSYDVFRKHCLDKQRVKDAIDKCIGWEDDRNLIQLKKELGLR